MTFTQLVLLIALGVIGLGLIASVTIIANGFLQLRAERRTQQNLLSRLNDMSHRDKS